MHWTSADTLFVDRYILAQGHAQAAIQKMPRGPFRTRPTPFQVEYLLGLALAMEIWALPSHVWVLLALLVGLVHAIFLAGGEAVRTSGQAPALPSAGCKRQAFHQSVCLWLEEAIQSITIESCSCECSCRHCCARLQAACAHPSPHPGHPPTAPRCQRLCPGCASCSIFWPLDEVPVPQVHHLVTLVND